MLRPFFSFYGGKWRDTPKRYPAPSHATIVEPFAGSAGYSVRYAHLDVILCDADPIIAGVWRYLIGVTPTEILSIPDVTTHVDDLQICAEAKSLVGFWLNKGVSRPCKTPSAWMRSGRYPGSFWGDRVRHTIASQLEAIRHWRVVEGCYSDLPDMRATWFVDPPYQKQGKHYSVSEIDYPALGRWCSDRKGQVIVCEATGADWLPFQDTGPVKTTRAGKPAREALWVRM